MIQPLPDCPLLSVYLSSGSSSHFVCSGGVNFYAVGENRELCRQCQWPGAGLNTVLDCPHADVYTYLEEDEAGRLSVRFKVECLAAAPQGERCAACPAKDGAQAQALKDTMVNTE